jgi:hypothetical protein
VELLLFIGGRDSCRVGQLAAGLLARIRVAAARGAVRLARPGHRGSPEGFGSVGSIRSRTRQSVRHPQTYCGGRGVRAAVGLREIVDRGDPSAKKALFEALIHEIKIQSDDSLVPIFKIPMSGPNYEEPAFDGPAADESTDSGAVRTLPRLVGDTGIEPVTSSV